MGPGSILLSAWTLVSCGGVVSLLLGKGKREYICLGIILSALGGACVASNADTSALLKDHGFGFGMLAFIAVEPGRYVLSTCLGLFGAVFVVLGHVWGSAQKSDFVGHGRDSSEVP